MIYLIHFDKPFGHAKHYIGYTGRDLETRIAEHKNNRGCALLCAVNNAGIGWNVVRTFEGNRAEERRLKQIHSPLLCPICNPKTWNTRGITKKR